MAVGYIMVGPSGIFPDVSAGDSTLCRNHVCQFKVFAINSLTLKSWLTETKIEVNFLLLTHLFNSGSRDIAM